MFNNQDIREIKRELERKKSWIEEHPELTSEYQNEQLQKEFEELEFIEKNR